MNKINQFDRKNLQNLRTEIDAALSTLAAKYGIDIHAGNASFSDQNATFKLELKAVSANGEDAYAAEYKKYAKLLGIEGRTPGQIFNLQDGAYKFRGLNMKSRKYPVVVDRVSDGRSFKIEPITFKFNCPPAK